jgi:hypothetical protein
MNSDNPLAKTSLSEEQEAAVTVFISFKASTTNIFFIGKNFDFLLGKIKIATVFKILFFVPRPGEIG